MSLETLFLTVVGEVAAPQQFLINSPASACRRGKIDGSSCAILDVCDNVGNHMEEPLRSEAINRSDRWATDRADRTRAATHRRPHIPRGARTRFLRARIGSLVFSATCLRTPSCRRSKCAVRTVHPDNPIGSTCREGETAKRKLESEFVFEPQGLPVSRAGMPRASSSCAHKPGRHATDRTVVELLLGSAPFVPVMQSADLGNCNNLADRLYRTRIRRILIQG